MAEDIVQYIMEAEDFCRPDAQQRLYLGASNAWLASLESMVAGLGQDGDWQQVLIRHRP